MDRQALAEQAAQRSFVPQGWVRELLRHRKKLVNERSKEKNRLQNIVEDVNIKLGSVVSDTEIRT